MLSRLPIVLAGALALNACTEPTPNYCETNADCKNAAVAFCDVNGEFGDSRTCIANPIDVDAGPNLVTVTLNLEGGGTGSVTSSDGTLDCSVATCTVEVSPGTTFSLTATPASGDSLVTWSGPCSGFEECAFDASENLTVAVTFEPEGAALWTATSILLTPVVDSNARVRPADIATDSQDNVVVVGQLVGTPDFGGGQLISGDASFTSAEVFAVKWDSSGAHVWSHAYSGTGFSDDFAQSVVTTSTDEVVIVGKFEDSLTFGEPAEALDGSTFDMFMAQLRPDGSHEFSKGIAGNGDATIVIDSSDEMMVSVNSLRFDWFNAVATSIGSLLPTPPSGEIVSTTVDGFGRAVVVGSVTDLVDFAPAAAGGEVGANAEVRPFVVKLDWNGSFHSRSSRLNDVEELACIVADPSSDGSYYVVGTVNQQVDLQGGGGGIIVPTGTRNGFIAKYSNTHSYLWSVHLPSSQESAVTACALDTRGNLMVGGSFVGDVKLTPASPIQSGSGAFVAKYEAATGAFVWGSIGAGSATVKALASDSVGRSTAVIQYDTSAFTMGGEVFPQGAGVPNLAVIQYAP